MCLCVQLCKVFHVPTVTNHVTPGLQLHKDALHVQIDLARLFPKHIWHFPSEDYLATGAGNASAWRSLFMSLGFTDFIQTPPQTLLLSLAQKAESIWAGADLGPADSNGNFTVQVSNNSNEHVVAASGSSLTSSTRAQPSCLALPHFKLQASSRSDPHQSYHTSLFV